MKLHFKKLFLTVLFLLIPNSVSAQLIPDRTLGNESSIVNKINELQQEINGGATRGNNLFHSFQEFNVNSGQNVIFNAPGINNIFTRVTGSNISNILGTLGVNGNGNLFLINPNGLIFGQEATLNMSGSFIGTTAESITFNNGFKFSAINPKTIENGITFNFPIQFGFGTKSGPIRVENRGHNLFKSPFEVNLTENLDPFSAIELKNNRSFTLLGNELSFDGGIVKADEIILGSIKKGIVSFDPILNDNYRWKVNYDLVSSYGKIALNNQSLLDISSLDLNDMPFQNVSSSNMRGLDLRGSEVTLTNGTILLSQSLTNSNIDKEIKIIASDSLEISDNSSNSFFDRNIKGGILSENAGKSSGTNILIETKNLSISNAQIFTTNLSNFREASGGNVNIKAGNINLEKTGNISTQNFGEGQGGNITIDILETLQIEGVNMPLDNVNSTISSINLSTGRGGNVNISGQNALLKNGGSIGSNLIFGTGNAGNINIKIADTIKLTGKGSFLRLPNVSANNPSRIISDTFSLGNGGNINIETSNLLIENGAEISTSTSGIGNAGQLTINSLEQIIVNNANIKASTNNPSASQREGLAFFGFPSEALGSAGNIDLRTNKLSVINGGSITTSNETAQNAGNITIDSKDILLDRGKIIAEAREGSGGNITIDTRILKLLNKSEISANVGFIDKNGVFQGFGNGGNININALSRNGAVAVLDRSAITANATLGRGGNIRIAAVALFTTPGSRIEAISRLGIDGIVEFELSQDSNKLISTIEQPYPNYVKSANEICQPINGDRESMKFGIRDVLPSKDVLSQGAWQYNFFFSEDERAKTQETWEEVFVPNATIETQDGQMYRTLVCITKITD